MKGYERANLFADLIWAVSEIFVLERKRDWAIVRTFSRYYCFLLNSKILVHFNENNTKAESISLRSKTIWTEQTNEPSTRQLLVTKDDTCAAVKRILDHEICFEVVPFKKYNTIVKLHSTSYKEYFFIRHAKMLHSAGWLLCRYAKKRRLTSRKGSIQSEDGTRRNK